MSHYEKIVSDLADSTCERVSNRVIRALVAMTRGADSGEPSILRNVWDEVCVQVQHEPSIYWEDYLRLVNSLSVNEVSSLELMEKQAVWLQTRDGGDWSIDNEDKEDVPTSDDDIAQYIVNDYVLFKAGGWTNHRIERFLEKEGDTRQFALPNFGRSSFLKGPRNGQHVGAHPIGESLGTDKPGIPRWKMPLPPIEEMTPTQEEWDRAMAERDAELAAKAPRDKDGNLVMVVMPPNDL